MSADCRVTARAQNDFHCTFNQLKDLSPAAALRFSSDFRNKIDLLSRFPEMGRARPEFGDNIRSLAMDAHVVYYRLSGDCAEILLIARPGESTASIMGRIYR